MWTTFLADILSYLENAFRIERTIKEKVLKWNKFCFLLLRSQCSFKLFLVIFCILNFDNAVWNVNFLKVCSQHFSQISFKHSWQCDNQVDNLRFTAEPIILRKWYLTNLLNETLIFYHLWPILLKRYFLKKTVKDNFK
jgi:hypothetical protein